MNNSKIPFDIRELSSSKALNFYKLLKSSFSDEIRPGQIWSTNSSFQLPNGQQFQTDESRLIVILLGEGKSSKKYDPITVAPLSIFTSMASESDFIVKQESSNSPLTFDFMVEVWNETPAIKGQLNKFIGLLSGEASKNLHQLYLSRLTNTEIPENLKKYTGMKIIAEDDPRRIFQEEELAAVTYLAKAATASLELQIEEQATETTETADWLKFELKPFLGKLSDSLGNLAIAPMIAHAANNIDTEEVSWLIMQSEKSEKFVFELLNSRQPPYSIYFKTRVVMPDIIGRNCIISVKTEGHLFRSISTTLKEGIKIEVGQDPFFRSKDVESVEVAIETK